MRHLIRGRPGLERKGDYYGHSFPAAAGCRGGRRGTAVDEPRGHGGPVRPPLLRPGTPYTLGPSSRSSRSSPGSSRRPGTIDPNGLMYLMRAVEYFDLERRVRRPRGGLPAGVSAPGPVRQLPPRLAVSGRRGRTDAGGDHCSEGGRGAVDARHLVLDSAMGHGAFLYDLGDLAARVSGFLDASRAMITTSPGAWDPGLVCRHIDGMAIGTTMAALHERGALAMLAARDRTDSGRCARAGGQRRVPARGDAPAGRPGLGRARGPG